MRKFPPETQKHWKGVHDVETQPPAELVEELPPPAERPDPRSTDRYPEEDPDEPVVDVDSARSAIDAYRRQRPRLFRRPEDLTDDERFWHPVHKEE